MYDFADAVIRYLNSRFIEMFSRLKTLTDFDEINILQSVKAVYKEADALFREMMYRIAVTAYENALLGDVSSINEQWLLDAVLEIYDPVTKYSYINEVERKCARLFESMAASENKAAEVDTALRLFSAMTAQYAITVTDAATKKAYEDSGISEVIWVTADDDRTCGICESREGEIYPIDDVPPKPHIGCRCYILPYRRRIYE